jgi:hypothetical protein
MASKSNYTDQDLEQLEKIFKEMKGEMDPLVSTKTGGSKDYGHAFQFKLEHREDIQKNFKNVVNLTGNKDNPAYHEFIFWKRHLEQRKPADIVRFRKKATLRKHVRAEARHLVNKMLF